MFALSSRLLLQALVTLPSSAGVVEELLATAAASTRIHTPNKTRSVGLAADVLSLIASGDISLAKVRSRPAHVHVDAGTALEKRTRRLENPVSWGEVLVGTPDPPVLHLSVMVESFVLCPRHSDGLHQTYKPPKSNLYNYCSKTYFYF